MPRKVLIITYYWPPAGGIGVVRWVKFAKYIRACGWEPTIFTVSNPSYPMIDESLEKDIPENIQVIKRPIWEPHQFYRIFSKNKNSGGLGDIKPKQRATFIERVSNWVRSNFFIPDARAFWIRPSIRFLKGYLRTNHFDAIISTGPPHSAHLIAGGIKKSIGLPWLADFRDPWTTMDYYKELLLSGWADKKHHRLEMEVLTKADAVTVVGNGMKQEFETKSGRKVAVVTNGFDEADFSSNESHLDNHFSIVHVGTFFSRTNPINLWKAIAELKDEKHPMFTNLKIRLTGRVDPAIVASIQNEGLNEFLVLTPVQQHQEAILQMSSAQVLLLCIFEQTKFVLTGKLFEYLAAKRPILSVGPLDGDAAVILKETNAGMTFSFDNKIGIKQHLIDLYQKYERGELNHCQNDSQKYSHRELVKAMVGELDQIVKP